MKQTVTDGRPDGRKSEPLNVITYIDFIQNLHTRSTQCSRCLTWRMQRHLWCKGHFWCYFNLTLDKNVFWKHLILFRPAPGMNTTPFFPSLIVTTISNFISMCRTAREPANIPLINNTKTSKSLMCLLRPQLYISKISTGRFNIKYKTL